MLKLLLIYFCFSSIQLLILSIPIPGNFTISYFNQKVDHYNYNNNDTFQQRIITSTKYIGEKNPPILFYCGNEGNIFAFVNNTGFMWELEHQIKAVLIFVEHRYYGTSFPKQTSKNDYSYLSIEQALTDFALVIDNLKTTNKNFANSPVIAFGGSYGGMLASWFRVKYPHLIQGAIAGSAPILQFLPYYDCSLFNKVVTKDYENYSQTCSNVIRNAWPAIRRLGNTEGGRMFLAQEFQLCDPIEKKDIDYLISYFTGIIVNIAMVDYPNAADFLKPLPAYPMKEICKMLNNDKLNDPDLIKSFKNAFYSIYLNYTGNAEKCVNLNADSTDLGAEGWSYQSCTETIMPICSNGIDDFFEPDPFNVTQLRKSCREIYDVELDPYKVRMEYSLSDLKAFTNVVFSNGDRDPWSMGGVLIDNYKKFGLKGNELKKAIFEYFGIFDEKNLNNIVFTNGPIIINIPGACHHEDLRSTGLNDTKELIAARRYETKIIQKWIRSYNSERSNDEENLI